jgi:protein TonB
MPWLRFPAALLLSGVVTVTLFTVLRALISVRAEVGEQASLSKVEFVRLKRSVEIEAKKREKVERVKPEQELVTPTLAVAEEEGVDLGLDVEAIARGLGQEYGSAGGGGGDGRAGALAFDAGLSDRDPLPLVRVEPEYPPQARQRKLEGWVQVRFTISSAGSVKDAVVVKSSHAMFERNAVQAVNKWKYQPQLRGGKPAETPGLQVIVRFKMKG